MNRYIYSLFFLVLLAACNKKKESDAMAMPDYFMQEIGVDNKGVYQVTGQDSIRDLWEEYVAQSLGSQKNIQLRDFRIIKGKAQGQEEETEALEYYMLVSSTADGKTKAAALLELRNGKFYFLKTDKDAVTYSVLVCTGDCKEGCDPVMSINRGRQFLNCSGCVECNKTDGEIGGYEKNSSSLKN